MILNRSSGITIPKEEVDQFWVSCIRQQLTRTSKSYENPDVVLAVEYFNRQSDGSIKIPRLFKLNNPDIEYNDSYTEGENINIEFKSQLRNKLQCESVQYMVDNDSGILKLNPGEGKTVISIAAICRIGKKAIILMHKDSLVSQWQERFLQHTNIKPEDIGILKTDKYKEVIKKPIVIGTVQTMVSMSKKIPTLDQEMKDANFGIGVWDECHTTGGAPLFSTSCYYVSAKKCFGLSATPGRSDHNDDVIWMHLGKVFSPEGTTNTLKPRIIQTFFDHGAMRYHRKYIMSGFPMKDANGKEIPRRFGFDNNRYTQMLYSKKNNRYISTLKSIIEFCYKNNRNILVICNRIKLLDKMAESFPKDDVGFFLPRSGKTRDEQLKRRIVFSTPGSSRDGTDNVNLDCLILATPTGNLIQAIGRVCRYKENKPQPLVFDLVDTGATDMLKWGLRRQEEYKDKVVKDGWKYEEKHIG